MGRAMIYQHAREHHAFARLVAALLEARFVPASVIERPVFRKWSDAIADDSPLTPDVAVDGVWITTSATTSTAQLSQALAQAERDAQLAGSTDPAALAVFRRGDGSADALVAMSVDAFAQLTARAQRNAQAEAVLAS